LAVNSIAVKTQPTDLSYTAGEALTLAGLEVTLVNNDGTTEDVALANFEAKSITVNYASGLVMAVATHHDHPVIVTCNSHTANTINLTVTDPVDITGAAVTIAAPLAGETPLTASAIQTSTDAIDFTVTSITWNQALTTDGKFKANTSYSATVVLTSKNLKEFQASSFTPTVAGSSSVGTTTTVGVGFGNTAIFTVTYAATADLSVSSLAVKMQPMDLSYIAGETLTLAGLEVTLTNNDGTIEDVAFADFSAKSITVNYASGLVMVVATHHNQPIIISCNSQTANTNALIVTAPPAGNTGGSKDALIPVGGQQLTFGSLDNGTNADGQNVTTVTLDETKLNQFIETSESSPIVIISVSNNSDIIDVKLNGIIINNLENKNVTLEIKTNLGSYTLPVSDINLESILKQFDGSVALADIQVSIQIAEPSADTVQLVQNAAKEGEFTIVVPAVDFTVKCTYNNQTVNVPSYDTYAQRTVAIPEGVDPTKITTGVIVEPDGTVNHVPTHVTIIDGKYYAVINSLTNSTYTVVWHPVEFADLTKYWAKDTINDLGSRMVVSGVDGKNYEPDRDITRAEFAVIVVKALGLKQAAFASSFKDVKKTDWFCGYDETATSYGLIAGYSNGKFGPNDKLTREQAMTIISRAMTVTKLNSGLTASQITTLISGYKDGKSVSVWAANGIASCLKTGIVTGKTSATLCPLDNITRAEVAVMVQRLLQKSNLI
jgi:nitrate reductase NapAB chaperone NapD